MPDSVTLYIVETRIQLRNPDDSPISRTSWEFWWSNSSDCELVELSRPHSGPVLFVAGSGQETRYRPLEQQQDDQSVIADSFAAIAKPDDIPPFVRRYGSLGMMLRETYLHSPYYREIPGWHPGLEPVLNWLVEAHDMRRVLRLLDAVQANDAAGLSRLIYWKRPVENGPLRPFYREGTSDSEWDPPIVLIGGPSAARRLNAGGLQEIARSYISALITRRTGHGTYGLVPKPSPKGKWEIAFVPRDLLAAIWLTVLQRATGARRVIPCEVCGQPMDVTGNRGHKRVHATCSNRERMRRYRASKGS